MSERRVWHLASVLDQETLEINANPSLTRIFSCGTGFGSTGNSGFGSTNTTGGGLFGGGSTGGFGNSGGMSTVVFCSGSFCWTRSLWAWPRSSCHPRVGLQCFTVPVFSCFLRSILAIMDNFRGSPAQQTIETQLDDRKSR